MRIPGTTAHLFSGESSDHKSAPKKARSIFCKRDKSLPQNHLTMFRTRSRFRYRRLTPRTVHYAWKAAEKCWNFAHSVSRSWKPARAHVPGRMEMARTWYDCYDGDLPPSQVIWNVQDNGVTEKNLQSASPITDQRKHFSFSNRRSVQYEGMPQSLRTPMLFDGWLIDWVRGYASKSAHFKNWYFPETNRPNSANFSLSMGIVIILRKKQKWRRNL